MAEPAHERTAGAIRGSAPGSEVRWCLEPVATAPAEVRRRLAGELPARGFGGWAADIVLLVTNELVTNAVEHARTSVDVRVEFDGGEVLVQVHDGSQVVPAVRAVDPLAARGRGLQLVGRLARSWSWWSTADGKVVWARVSPAG